MKTARKPAQGVLPFPTPASKPKSPAMPVSVSSRPNLSDDLIDRFMQRNNSLVWGKTDDVDTPWK